MRRQQSLVGGGGSSVTCTASPGRAACGCRRSARRCTSNSRARVRVGSTSRRIIWRAGRAAGLAFVGRVEHGALAERRGEDLALGLQRVDLLSISSPRIAEIEKAEREQRQRQHVDREDAAGQRRYGGHRGRQRWTTRRDRPPARRVRRLGGRRRFAQLASRPAARLRRGIVASAVAVSISDAIERFDLREFAIDRLELLAQAA